MRKKEIDTMGAALATIETLVIAMKNETTSDTEMVGLGADRLVAAVTGAATLAVPVLRSIRDVVLADTEEMKFPAAEGV